MPNLSVSICHYETPLRHRGNLTNLVAYEIASIVPLSPKKLHLVNHLY
jgi:hypothetical protein